MKNRFTLGVLAGISSIALAIPILAQVSSAAPNASSPSFDRPVPTQEQVQAMADRDAAFLKNIDALMTIQKSAKQAHLEALTAAAAITDDSERHVAVQKANDAERTALQSAIAANPDLQSLRMHFGNRGFGGRGGMGRGPDTTELAAKLGMTEAELEAALADGKTIPQIAQEKGVTLPALRKGGKGRFGDDGRPCSGIHQETAETPAQ